VSLVAAALYCGVPLLASEMQMSWGGVVDWTPDAKVRIAEATDEISRRLEVDDETANRLWEGMSDVYELMAIKGLCTPAVSSPCASFLRRWSSPGQSGCPA
jgi:hypothetical protein